MASFPSVRIEGGLLGPDLLEQLVAGDLPGQRPADFGLNGRRNLTAELAATFADARAYWSAFGHRLERLQEGDLATTPTRDAWVVPLLGLLGYELQLNRRAHEVDGLTFAISHRAGEADEAPPVHIVGARQELGRLPPSGRPRLAPHSLVQEYLNRTEQVWGIVTNGLVLRLLRNSSFVRRQAYVEFDLQQMLEEQRFADFAVLYRLLHRTRLRRGADGADECLLDRYYAHSREQGDRVREHLREGVEECIQRLANGFLRHPANNELRRRVTTDAPENEHITADDLYRQLLRLVYRLLFLLVSEDRGLLSPDRVYREHYGVARLRRLLDQRAAFTGRDDIWQSLRVLWRVLSDDRLAELLRLAPLNGELFVPQESDNFTLSNRDMLEAFWFLAWYQQNAAPPRRVNYAALDVEELGSIYESLLDFHPAIDADGAGRPAFALIEGTERKTTGSYYTPPQLVAELIKSTLDPVIADRIAAAPPGEREHALLSIRVCDPACGSGHFLLAAARRIGKVLAQERTSETEPAPEPVREAIRDAIAHCMYGVDKNPLAVDLCRVALWLESHTGDKPLTFLDHRIRCGDALVGAFDVELLKEGIPDEAFKPLNSDDTGAARALARRNRSERKGQRDLFAWKPDAELAGFTRTSRVLDQIGDDTPEAIRRKKELFEQSHANPAWRRQREAHDLWTAAFFQPLRPELLAITTSALVEHLAGDPNPRLCAAAWDLSLSHHFFHWQLEFPEVFADGGFDVVMGNPPYLSAIEQKSSGVRAQKKLWSSTFASATGAYDIYVLFLELVQRMINPSGRSSLLTPNKYLAAPYGQGLRYKLITEGRLIGIVDVSRWGAFSSASVYPIISVFSGTRVPDAEPIIAKLPAETSHEFVEVSHDREFTSTLPNQNLGILLSRGGALLRKIISSTLPLGQLLTINASTTAAEADEFTSLLREEEHSNGLDAWRVVNTGLIDPFQVKWGTTNLRHSGLSLARPYLLRDGSVISARRTQHYSSPKIIVAKLGKYLEAFFDESGTYAALNVNFVFVDDLEGYFYLGQMNSMIASWIYRQEFGALSMSGDYMQFQAPQLRAMPVVPYREGVSEHTQIASLAQEASARGCNDRLLASIDLAVADMIGISEDELQTIRLDTSLGITSGSTT